MGDVVDPEIRHHSVERRIGIGQCLGIACVEAQPRVAPPRLGQHRGGKIHAGRDRAARRGGRRDDPGTAADIERPNTGPDRGRVKQCRGKLR